GERELSPRPVDRVIPEGFAEDAERVAQAVARLRLVAIAPEERGQLVARLTLTGSDREVGDQRLGFRGQRRRRAAGGPGLETSEKRQRGASHGRGGDFPAIPAAI